MTDEREHYLAHIEQSREELRLRLDAAVALLRDGVAVEPYESAESWHDRVDVFLSEQESR